MEKDLNSGNRNQSNTDNMPKTNQDYSKKETDQNNAVAKHDKLKSAFKNNNQRNAKATEETPIDNRDSSHGNDFTTQYNDTKSENTNNRKK